MAKTSSSKTRLTDADRAAMYEIALQRACFDDENDWDQIGGAMQPRPSRRRVYGRNLEMSAIAEKLKALAWREISRIR